MWDDRRKPLKGCGNVDINFRHLEFRQFFCNMLRQKQNWLSVRYEHEHKKLQVAAARIIHNVFNIVFQPTTCTFRTEEHTRHTTWWICVVQKPNVVQKQNSKTNKRHVICKMQCLCYPPTPPSNNFWPLSNTPIAQSLSQLINQSMNWSWSEDFETMINDSLVSGLWLTAHICSAI